MQKFDLDNFLPYQLAVLAGRVSLAFSRTYREKFGISIAEWRVIAHLSQREKISIREIYQRVELDKSKVSRAAARLVKAGYVQKVVNQSDKRLVELSLTKSGRAMTAEIVILAAEFESGFLSSLNKRELAGFKAALGNLMEQDL